MTFYRSFLTKSLNNYSNFLKSAKSFSKSAVKLNTATAQPIKNIAETIGNVQSNIKSSDRIIGFWLGGCAGMVAGAVVLGKQLFYEKILSLF